jgi:hypothetical protein
MSPLTAPPHDLAMNAAGLLAKTDLAYDERI